jgi:two-component system, cell cycle sensor histidine kinase and response regulator CckA
MDSPISDSESNQTEERDTSSGITCKLLFESSNDSVFFVRDDKVIEANSHALDMFGCERDDFIGKRLTDLSPAYQSDGSPSADRIIELNKRLASGEPQRFQWRFLRNDGKQFIAEVAFSLLIPGRGNMIMIALRNVTQKKTVMELYESMYRINPIPMILTDLEEGRLIDVNESFVSIFGFTREEAVGKTSLDIGIWKEPGERRRYLDLSAREGQVRDYYVLSCNKKGEQMSLLLNSAVIQYGERKALMIMAQDITMLRQAETSLRTVFEESPSGLIVAELYTGRVIAVNKRYLQMTGYIKDEVLGHNTAEFGDLPKSVLERLVSLLGLHGGFDNQETRFICKNREEITVLISTRIIQFEGRPVALFVYADITSQKQAELAMRESEEKFSKLFSASPDFILVSDIETGLILEANDGLKDLMGSSNEDRVGKTSFDLGLWTDLNERARFVDEVRKKGECFDFLTKFQSRDGNVFDVAISSKAIDFGGRKCMINVVKDMSEMVRLEEQLRHAQKLEAVGRLAEDVANDFSNLLDGLLGNIKLAMSVAGENSQVKNSLDSALDIVNKAIRLSHNLLAFSCRQAMDRETASVRDVILKSEKFLKRLIGADIEFSLSLKDDAIVDVDALQIERVVTNMVVNARDAMPMGGKLTISSERVEVDESIMFHRQGRKPGSFICIMIGDTGLGMTKEVMDRMYDPFFTTKDVGKGSGLGLSTAYGIIRQHGGFLSVYSDIGIGSQFSIFLPVVPGEAMQQEVKKDTASKSNPEVVLIAEEDDIVRSLNKRFLEKSGYIVLEARDGDETLQIFSSNVRKIDLLVLDMIMPKKNGKEIFDAIRVIRPSMKFLFISGYTSEYFNERTELGDGIELMLKPVSPRVLLNKVREILDR